MKGERIKEFLETIGQSKLIGKAATIAGQAVSGNYLGALKTLISSGKENMTEEQRAFALKLIEQDMVEMQEVSKRWESDMVSDSWLSKNIRPLILAFLVFVVTILAIIDSTTSGFEVKDHWISLFSTILSTVVIAYFGSRGSEKVMKIFKK